MEIFTMGTPWKIIMEPKNLPIEKENHLNQTSTFGFHVSFLPPILAEVDVDVFQKKNGG